MTFGERLKFLIESKKVDLDDLAKKMNMEENVLKGWIDESIKPNKRELLRLSIILNVKSDYLVGTSLDLLYGDESHKIDLDYKERISSLDQNLSPEEISLRESQDKLFPEMLLCGLLSNPAIEEHMNFQIKDIDSMKLTKFLEEVFYQIELISWKYKKEAGDKNKDD